jgi:geranylgeranylglycerol-phosphate geranylgeranyltransferase
MAKGFFNIIRPLNCLITFIAIIVSGLICTKNNHISTNLFLAGLVGFLITAAGNSINDIIDIDIDRINRPNRPLPSLKITFKQAWVLFVQLLTASLALSLFLGQFAFLIVLLSNALLILYSFTIKRVPLFGNIVISFLTAYAFIFGGMVVGNVNGAFVPAIFAFLINLIREVIKDMEDIKGDKLAGVNTFPIKYGSKAAKYFVLAVSSFLFLFTFVPFLFHIYEIEFFLIIMIIVNPMLFYIVKSLFEDSSQRNLGRLSSMLKFNMVIGLIAIYVGK